MKNILYFLLFISSVGYSQTPITDDNFYEAISDCLSTHPVTGLCVDSEYGSMPDWDVSDVTNMADAFQYRTDFNAEIEGWDVSNVTDMQEMFSSAESFNQDIGDWDVSNVTDMEGMFENATSFNQPIGEWDVSNVTNMEGMFVEATSFNRPIGEWDVSNVTNMGGMFIYTSFNQPIGDWNVSNVTNMGSMFGAALAFNQPIGDWDVSNVTNMSYMFAFAPLVIFFPVTTEEDMAFNQPIGDWDVSNVTDMSYMFGCAFYDGKIESAFNQPIGDWDVSNVTDMSYMFRLATSFNQPIGEWDVSNVTDVKSMFNGSDLNTCNYDNTLQGWSTLDLTQNLFLGGTDALDFGTDTFYISSTVNYCNSETERQSIIDNFGWTIQDGGLDCSDPCLTSGISELNTITDLRIFPNPTNKLFHVEMTLSESIDLQMQVMDIHGRIVHKESMNNLGGKVSKSIDLSDEPSGTYLLRFINGEQVKNRKIVLQNLNST